MNLLPRYRRTHDPVGRSHWRFLWLLARGFPAKTIAHIRGYSAYWIGQIACRYNALGREGVKDQRRLAQPGRQLLTAAARSCAKTHARCRYWQAAREYVPMLMQSDTAMRSPSFRWTPFGPSCKSLSRAPSHPCSLLFGATVQRIALPSMASPVRRHKTQATQSAQQHRGGDSPCCLSRRMP
jgi:hypothetical protein